MGETLKLALIFWYATALIPGISCSFCDPQDFMCNKDSRCLPKSFFCNDVQNCNDGSDEKYCDFHRTMYSGGCPSDWWKCNDGRCIPSYWRCNGDLECMDSSDEDMCKYEDEKHLPKSNKQKMLITWLLKRQKGDNSLENHEAYRTAIALYLADKGYFSPWNSTGQKVASEVKYHILTSLTSANNFPTKELPLIVHALMVTCNDPRDFYGFNLVSKLMNYIPVARPMDLLALCNANEYLSPQGVLKAAEFFNSKFTTSTTDNQALAFQALSCIQSRGDFTLDAVNMTLLEEQLKNRLSTSGTIVSFKTTALVLQALMATQNFDTDFKVKMTMDYVLNQQKWDGSFGTFLDSYYVMPLISGTSFLDISNDHCDSSTKNDLDTTSWNQKENTRIRVKYSICVKCTFSYRTTTELYVINGSSIYKVLEIINIVDTNQKIRYDIENKKPFVSSVNDVQADMELDLKWHTYLYRRRESELIEESPADVKIAREDEIVLWYK